MKRGIEHTVPGAMMHAAARRMPSLALAPALLASALLASALPARAQAGPLAGLDGYINAAMRDWEVPGLAIAVVRDDSVIFARGYGVREAGGREPVDEQTLFAIASTTKAMTVGALGMLVDEGRLHWDDPVSRHLPGFQLRDPYVTRDLRVRDLLTHRSGLVRSDNVWIAAPYDRSEILGRTRHIPEAASFRSEYGYNNIMYIAAGELVAAASGRSWDDFVGDRIFRPLGMTRSTTRAAEVEMRENVASSHTLVGGEVTPVPRRDYDNIGGAGAAFSSALELAQWLRLHLNGGAYAGVRLLADSTIREMHTPQTIIPTDSVDERLFPHTNFRAYGLGWVLQDYRGRKLVHHSGSLNWTRTQLGMIPSEGLGVAVITNLGSSNLQQAVMYRVLDALIGAPPRDWSAELLQLAERGRERSAKREAEEEAGRVHGTTPSLALERYAGTYADDLYGDVRITMEDGGLVLRYAPDYVADLEHWHHDTFRADWRRPGYGTGWASFSLDARAQPASLRVDGFGEFGRVREPEEGEG